MNKLSLWWRLLRVAWHVVSGCVQIALWFRSSSAVQKQIRIQQWSAQLLNICGMGMVVTGEAVPSVTGRLWVANHISWLDMFAINAIVPMRFVAKADVQTWPIIGWLAQRADTIFMQRHNRRAAMAANRSISAALTAAANIAIFPEGTTTDGSHIQAFKSSLFQAAIDAHASVQPLLLQYVLDGGASNKAAAYCGDTSLWQSLCALLQQPHSQVRIHLLPTINTQGLDRQQLCQLAQAQLNHCLLQQQAASSSHYLYSHNSTEGITSVL